MPKRRKSPRTPSRHSAERFSPTQSQRKSRNDYQVAGPSCSTYVSQNAPKKPMFRGPETDVLQDLVKDKLKNIRVQMIRADLQQNDSFRQAYMFDDSIPNRSKGENNYQQLSCFNSTWMHYDNADQNYEMNHSLSPTRIMSRNQSISPQSNISRPPSPPLPYSPNRDHFNSDNMLPRDRPERSPKRKIHKRPSRDFKDQHKINNFSSSPPESRSPDMHRFRSGDHSRHQIMDEPIRFDNRSRCSGSPPGYFRNNYSFKSSSPDNRSFSPNHGQSPMSPPSLWDSPLRDRPPYSNNRLKRRRSSPRRDHSRDRRRRRYHFSPRETRRRISPPERSPMKHRDNPRKRPNKNQEGRKRDTKDRKRRSQSNPKSRSQNQQSLFQEPQPIYPHGVVQLPPPLRPFPPIIPLRPPHFPSMGAWRPRMPPPSGWPYPCPRPYYFPF